MTAGRPIWDKPERWYAGLTGKGLAVITLLCLLNALRRASTTFFQEEPLVEWLLGFAQAVGTGLVVALPMTVAVVFTYNRVPPASRLRYPALALALAVSSAAGVTIHGALEY
jgi:hypothetical protein